MRDVVVFAVVFGALPFAFLRPFYGLLLFTWLAYMRAPDLSWGAARSFRFSLIVGAVMFLGWFLFDKRPFLRRDRRNFYMIALAAMVSLSYLFAYYHTESATGKFIEFLKVIAVAVFTTAQLDSKNRVRVLVLLMALSFAFYGVKGGIWGLILQDARIIRGPGGLLLDNNDFSLAMVMNIPFLYYLAFAEEDRRLKLFLRAAVFLTVMTIVMTGSRGGFLALATVFFALVLKSRYKRLAIPGALAAGVLFLIFIPADYRERIASIRTAAREDASAIGRLRAWGVAREMIIAHPLLGVGFQNFVYAYKDFDPDVDKSVVRVAHNSYLQIWAETGTVSFLFFLAALGSTILLMRRLQRLNRVRDGPPWIGYYACIIEVSLYGFLMGAMFLNRGHFDFVYQEIAVGVALYPIALAEMVRRERLRTGRRGPARLLIRERGPSFAGGAW